ncbi:MAG: rod shape-determining protein MreC, partial [Actinomycetota bacterium]|nr:rod shape-determining protein MreC [Actinomycetota bacterium]
SGASRALKPFRDAIAWTGATLSAKGENDRLRGEVGRLRRDLAATQTARRDAEQLSGFAEIARADGFPQGTAPVTARVIARSPTVWWSSVQVNKGSSDGIEVDQPVITGDGLAGKVTAVTGGTATVTLITDERSSVSAQVMPGGADGIVRPKVGDPNDLLLDFVEKGGRIKTGQTVVTSGFRASSGLESLFPRGIPVGRVKKVDRSELEIYQTVHIDPFAELKRMDFVQVLTAARQGARAEVPSQ